MAAHPPVTLTSGGSRAARLISLVFQPMLTGLYLLLAVSIGASRSPGQAAFWAAVLALLTSGMPALDLARRLKAGSIGDFQLILREERLRPLVVALGWTAAGLVVAVLFGAPRPLIATVAVGVANGLVLTAVTAAWKISFHTATLTGALIVLAVLFEPAVLSLLPLVVAVGWSRVRLGRHTPGQTVAGACAAAVVTPAVLWALM